MSKLPELSVSAVVALLFLFGPLATIYSPPAIAAIYRWDNGELITEMNAEPRARLSDMDLSYADMVGAPLLHADFGESNLTYAQLTRADLYGADLSNATLADADFTDAVVKHAIFNHTTDKGFTAGQLYSTASYQSGDLSGIRLRFNDLSGWNFAEKNLSGATFSSSTLANSDFTDAVVNGASFGWTTGFTAGQLYSTASYQSGDLSGIRLESNDLTGWDFTGKNLAGAHLESNVTDADFSGAVINDAWFNSRFTPEQLYSTESYQSGDLTGVHLPRNDLSGCNFVGKDLTDASFYVTTLAGADFSRAILRHTWLVGADLTNANFNGANLMDSCYFYSGEEWHVLTLTGADLSFSDLRTFNYREVTAWLFQPVLASVATTEAAILPDGRIEGLALDAGEHLNVRDYNGICGAIPITIESTMALDSAAALRMVFEDDDWGSTISFEPGIAVSLDGTLELLFADAADPSDLIGITFDLFDWEGAVVSGTFDHIVTEQGAVWDTSRLYSTGEVMLIPEPSGLVLLTIGACCLAVFTARWWRQQES